MRNEQIERTDNRQDASPVCELKKWNGQMPPIRWEIRATSDADWLYRHDAPTWYAEMIYRDDTPRWYTDSLHERPTDLTDGYRHMNIYRLNRFTNVIYRLNTKFVLPTEHTNWIQSCSNPSRILSRASQVRQIASHNLAHTLSDG